MMRTDKKVGPSPISNLLQATSLLLCRCFQGWETHYVTQRRYTQDSASKDCGCLLQLLFGSSKGLMHHCTVEYSCYYSC